MEMLSLDQRAEFAMSVRNLKPTFRRKVAKVGMKIRFQNNYGVIEWMNDEGFYFVGEGTEWFEPWEEAKRGGWYVMDERKN